MKTVRVTRKVFPEKRGRKKVPRSRTHQRTQEGYLVYTSIDPHLGRMGENLVFDVHGNKKLGVPPLPITDIIRLDEAIEKARGEKLPFLIIIHGHNRGVAWLEYLKRVFKKAFKPYQQRRGVSIIDLRLA